MRLHAQRRQDGRGEGPSRAPRKDRSTIAAATSPRVSQLAAMEELANQGPRVREIAQLQESLNGGANRTGLSDGLKTGLEQLSGLDLSGVRVHYNSPRPAQLQALAYTQGQDIHVAPGQERHVPHEGWHVVQQMQGRVQPTTQLAGMAVNDSPDLEREADAMGARAGMSSEVPRPMELAEARPAPSSAGVVQGVFDIAAALAVVLATEDLGYGFTEGGFGYLESIGRTLRDIQVLYQYVSIRQALRLVRLPGWGRADLVTMAQGIAAGADIDIILALANPALGVPNAATVVRLAPIVAAGVSMQAAVILGTPPLSLANTAILALAPVLAAGVPPQTAAALAGLGVANADILALHASGRPQPYLVQLVPVISPANPVAFLSQLAAALPNPADALALAGLNNRGTTYRLILAQGIPNTPGVAGGAPLPLVLALAAILTQAPLVLRLANVAGAGRVYLTALANALPGGVSDQRQQAVAAVVASGVEIQAAELGQLAQVDNNRQQPYFQALVQGYLEVGVPVIRLPNLIALAHTIHGLTAEQAVAIAAAAAFRTAADLLALAQATPGLPVGRTVQELVRLASIPNTTVQQAVNIANVPGRSFAYLRVLLQAAINLPGRDGDMAQMAPILADPRQVVQLAGLNNRNGVFLVALAHGVAAGANVGTVVQLADSTLGVAQAADVLTLANIAGRALPYLQVLAQGVGAGAPINNVSALAAVAVGLGNAPDVVTLANTPGRGAAYVRQLAAHLGGLPLARNINDLVVLGDVAHNLDAAEIPTYLGLPNTLTGLQIARIAGALRAGLGNAGDVNTLVNRLHLALGGADLTAMVAGISALLVPTLNDVSQGAFGGQSFAVIVNALLGGGWNANQVQLVLQDYENQANPPAWNVLSELLDLARQHGFAALRVRLVLTAHPVGAGDWAPAFVQFANFDAAGHAQPAWPDGMGGNVLPPQYPYPSAIGGYTVRTRIRQERLNHFRQGHTYERFRFSLPNITRPGSPFSFWPIGTVVEGQLRAVLGAGLDAAADTTANTGNRTVSAAGNLSFVADGIAGLNRNVQPDMYYPTIGQRAAAISTERLRIIGRMLGYAI